MFYRFPNGKSKGSNLPPRDNVSLKTNLGLKTGLKIVCQGLVILVLSHKDLVVLKIFWCYLAADARLCLAFEKDGCSRVWLYDREIQVDKFLSDIVRNRQKKLEFFLSIRGCDCARES